MFCLWCKLNLIIIGKINLNYNTLQNLKGINARKNTEVFEYLQHTLKFCVNTISLQGEGGLTRKSHMEEKSIKLPPCTDENEKWRIWSVKFMARAGIKVFNVLLRGYMKPMVRNSDETKYKQVMSIFKILNNTGYNELIIYQ